LISARDILKEDGAILVTCGCEEGLGSKEFCSIMRSHSTPQDFNQHHSDPDNFVIDQWCAQNIYQALDHAGKVYIYSPGLTGEDVAHFQGVKVEDVQKTLNQLLESHKKVVVIPDGPYVVGKIKGK
jgi:nickel-dependent lactate racemase